MAQSRAFDEVCGVFLLIVIVYLYFVFMLLFFGEGVVIFVNHFFCNVCEVIYKVL